MRIALVLAVCTVIALGCDVLGLGRSSPQPVIHPARDSVELVAEQVMFRAEYRRERQPQNGQIQPTRWRSLEPRVARIDTVLSSTRRFSRRAVVLVIGAGEARIVASYRGRSDTAHIVATGWTQVTTGNFHSCGLDEHGKAYCWGQNGRGQIGNGSDLSPDQPDSVAGGLRFKDISAGDKHTCGVTQDGDVFCWGHNRSGQLGIGNQTDHSAPVPVDSNQEFTEVSSGGIHTCALTQSGEAYCWGPSTHGRLGNDRVLAGHEARSPVPVHTERRLESITAGAAHSCALSGEEVLCWGLNKSGQLGNPSVDLSTGAPVAVETDRIFRSVRASGHHTCGVTTRGTAFCWGANGFGQLGDGSAQDRPRPTRITGDPSFQYVEPGAGRTCGTTDDGTGYCWGVNDAGVLGDGTESARQLPTAIKNAPRFKIISSDGWYHTCGVSQQRGAFCWGSNFRNQLGVSPYLEDSHTPVPVIGGRE